MLVRPAPNGGTLGGGMNELTAAGPPHRGRFYRDERGAPRADFDPLYEVVGWFLEQDVQRSSVRQCDELIAIVDETMAATRSSYRSSGNVHTLIFEQGGVRIENDYVEPSRSAVLSLDEFREAVLDWKVLIRDRDGEAP
jgi:Uncharacterised protein family (UPF0231)